LHGHNLNKYSWEFSSHDVGAIVTAKLKLLIPPSTRHANPLIDLELPTLFLLPGAQLTLTVRFGTSNHQPQPLLVNLLP
jgi:hypothetical protein